MDDDTDGILKDILRPLNDVLKIKNIDEDENAPLQFEPVARFVESIFK